MKRISALLLSVLLVVGLAACGQPASAEKDYTLGLGIVTGTAESTTGKVVGDATVAAVVLDADGKIVACRLDGVQGSVTVTDGLLPDGTAGKVFATKQELKENYNMVTYGGAVAEWYVQANAFANYAVGKTVAEIKNMATAEKDGRVIPADATLAATCTVDITDFQAAIVKAGGETCRRTFKAEAVKLGLSAVFYADESSKSADDTADGAVKLYGDYAAAVTDASGKILAAVTDSAQAEVTFDVTGAIKKNAAVSTKRELGDNYNMVTYGGAKAEWYAQADAFEAFVAGKTADEVAAIAVGDDMKPTDETLKAGCTIQVDGMMKVVSAAARAAA